MFKNILISVLAAGILAGCVTPAVSPLQSTLVPSETNHVLLTESEWLGQKASRLELTSDEQALQLNGAGGNRPTLVVLGKDFSNGVIEVDVAASLNGKGGTDSRGFIGIAFHIDDSLETFEAVYLRMSNGTLNTPLPPPPRDVRAIQYVAHPGFHFQDSRKVAPGRYEKPAAVALGRWHKLHVQVENNNLSAFVDGKIVLQIDDLKYANQSGQLGIWVGEGTTAYAKNFKFSRN